MLHYPRNNVLQSVWIKSISDQHVFRFEPSCADTFPLQLNCTIVSVSKLFRK